MSPSAEVAIFADRGSEQAREIAAAVTRHGGSPVVLDIQLGGGDAPFSLSYGFEDLRWGGVDFSSIGAVHIRCTAPRTLPLMPPVLNAATEAAYRADYELEQEFQAATMGFFETLNTSGRLVVNPLTRGYVDHDSKSQLYERLRHEGYLVPRSLTTNCPATAAGFLDEVGEVVVKPTIGIGASRVVTREDRARLHELEAGPVLFQERVRGKTVRLHVVAQTMVLAVAVGDRDDEVDSRTGLRDFSYIQLDEEEGRRIAAATRSLGLHYAAWDVMMLDDGRLCYLDCNPGPYVMWIGSEFRSIVFDRLAAYLVTYARSRSLEEAAASVLQWRTGA